jgi:dTDP-glucose 4,6-dehydratase
LDHCTAIDLVASSDKYGEIYNVGGHNEKNNLQIADLILKALGKPSDMIKFVEDRKAHDRRYAIDPSKIKRDFGWEPTVMFEDGIKMTFEWYRENTEWVKETEARIIDFIKEK